MVVRDAVEAARRLINDGQSARRYSDTTSMVGFREAASAGPEAWALLPLTCRAPLHLPQGSREPGETITPSPLPTSDTRPIHKWPVDRNPSDGGFPSPVGA